MKTKMLFQNLSLPGMRRCFGQTLVPEGAGTALLLADDADRRAEQLPEDQSPVRQEKSMDIRHHYIECGQGEPMILLHGNGENCEYFRGQMETFGKRFHVYAIDTRGHGKTPRGDKPFTIRQFAEDLLGFMDEHQVGKAHLLGFSDGGNIAMVFAIQHPERVDRLVLNGANMDAAGVKPLVQIPIEIEYRIMKLFSGFSGVAKQKAELLGLMVNDPNVSPEELKTIRAKTLVIAGSDDMIRDSHTRFITKCIPDSTLVIIKGDHFVANKRPIAFNRAVLGFLTGDKT